MDNKMKVDKLLSGGVKLFSKGNSKLSKDVLTWSITAGMKICGRECEGCYALKEQKRFPSIVEAREARYEVSKNSKAFRQVAIAELQKYGKKYVRVHASGEFYSQEYVDTWEAIAKELPHLTFFTYTKRMEDFKFDKLKALPNFVTHNSLIDLDGTIVKNYGNVAKIATKLPESFICPLATDRTGMCGESCTWCMEKENEGIPILFPKH